MNGHQLKFFHESPQVKGKFVANLSLVLPILCDDVPWWAPEELPSPIFYMLSLCLHFIACSHLRQCAFQMWWEGLEKKSVFCFCLMFTIFLYLLLFFCFCIMFSFCVCICFLFVVLSVFYICMLFLFFCICFVLLLFLLF